MLNLYKPEIQGFGVIINSNKDISDPFKIFVWL